MLGSPHCKGEAQEVVGAPTLVSVRFLQRKLDCTIGVPVRYTECWLRGSLLSPACPPTNLGPHLFTSREEPCKPKSQERVPWELSHAWTTPSTQRVRKACFSTEPPVLQACWRTRPTFPAHTSGHFAHRRLAGATAQGARQGGHVEQNSALRGQYCPRCPLPNTVVCDQQGCQTPHRSPVERWW